jgi:peptidoglycan/xylan/chitin deacetylase (PgdA/CDA1 family)
MMLGAALPAMLLVTRQSRNRKVPFLITADVHPRPNCESELFKCLDQLQHMGVKITILVPATIAAKPSIASILRRAVAEGHQVGCHGLTHDGDEDYLTNSFEVQLRSLSEAKCRLEDSVGCGITAFRAPAFRISKHTFNILDSLGFSADLSICSQRVPLLSSQVENYQLLFAPRAPYHPSAANPYAKGNLKLLEIPTSAAGLPLMSSVNGLSVTAMKLLTTALRVEATVFIKPIVYQCHCEDFVHYKQERQPFAFTWKSLIPNERTGIALRWALVETDGDVLYTRNRDFLSFLMGTNSFHFGTVDDYLRARNSSLG